MLRITIQESSEALTFRVEGKLVGEWAKTLEQSWSETAALRDRRAPIVDLSETSFIDQEGRRVLKKLFEQGAFFRTACPMNDSIVSEITGRRNRILREILSAVLLILLAPFAKAAQPEPLRLTLREAVGIALKQNPQVEIANLNTAVTQEQQIVAESRGAGARQRSDGIPVSQLRED